MLSCRVTISLSQIMSLDGGGGCGNVLCPWPPRLKWEKKLNLVNNLINIFYHITYSKYRLHITKQEVIKLRKYSVLYRGLWRGGWLTGSRSNYRGRPGSSRSYQWRRHPWCDEDIIKNKNKRNFPPFLGAADVLAGLVLFGSGVDIPTSPTNSWKHHRLCNICLIHHKIKSRGFIWSEKYWW